MTNKCAPVGMEEKPHHPNAKPFQAIDPPFPKFAFMIVIKGGT